ncbi:RNA-binding protein, partial [Bacillus amyloliquefaciens]|nr:RNA-binding protein [Bacillus amyloliquefaciens]
TFSSEQSMRDAIEGMNGKELDGRNITVNEAQSRRSGGGGGG